MSVETMTTLQLEQLTKLQAQLKPRSTSSTFAPRAPGRVVARGVAVPVRTTDPPYTGTPRPDLEAPLVVLVNAHRASIGVRPVKLATGPLKGSAEYKSLNMAEYMYMAHDDPAPPPPRTVGARIVAFGYPGWDAWGENIAYGFTSPQDVMDAWLSDSGHKANIENPLWTTIGVGVAEAFNGLLLWTQDFGTTDDTVNPDPPPPPPPPPPPGETVLTHWMQNVLPLIIADPTYLTWLNAKKNAADVKRWQAFVAVPQGPVPVMTTPKGKWLVADLALAAAS